MNEGQGSWCVADAFLHLSSSVIDSIDLSGIRAAQCLVYIPEEGIIHPVFNRLHGRTDCRICFHKTFLLSVCLQSVGYCWRCSGKCQAVPDASWLFYMLILIRPDILSSAVVQQAVFRHCVKRTIHHTGSAEEIHSVVCKILFDFFLKTQGTDARQTAEKRADHAFYQQKRPVGVRKLHELRTRDQMSSLWRFFKPA